MRRLFLALWPSAQTLAQLNAFAAGCRWPKGARLTPERKLHLTLHFIGDVEQELAASLPAALAMPAAEVALELDAREVWGRGLAALVATRVPEPLAELHAGLAARLRALGLAVERRPFKPHVTLARDAGGCFPPCEDRPVAWRSTGYALVESVAGQYGNLAVYTAR